MTNMSTADIVSAIDNAIDCLLETSSKNNSSVVERLRYAKDAMQSQDVSDASWILSRIIDDLPSNRDWLDPTIERAARDCIGSNPPPSVEAESHSLVSISQHSCQSADMVSPETTNDGSDTSSAPEDALNEPVTRKEMLEILEVIKGSDGDPIWQLMESLEVKWNYND